MRRPRVSRSFGVSFSKVNRAHAQWPECEKAVKAVGLPPEFAGFCTPFFLLHNALAKTRDVTPEGLRRGVDQLGSAPYSITTFGTFYGPNRHDGPGQARYLA